MLQSKTYTYLVLSSSIIFSSLLLKGDSAVTFELNGGRLGDNLMTFARAKWIALKYNLPLYYSSFDYIEAFSLFENETAISRDVEQQYKNKTKLAKSNENCSYNEASTLYCIPYFPEASYERSYYPSSPYFEVNWTSPEFKSELRKSLAPRNPIKPLDIPQDAISIAMHVRRGGGYIYDDANVKNLFPQKFPSDDFYLTALRHITDIFSNKRCYVFIFTDDPNPAEIAQKYAIELNNKNIKFDFHQDENRHNLNVLEDFFNLQLFRCLIRPQSNFSFLAAKLHDYDIEISPSHAMHNGAQWIIDQYLIINRTSCSAN